MSAAPPVAKLSLVPGVRFVEVVALMNRLLAEDGCPWDKEQTLTTLRPYVLEEAYEVLDALDAGDVAGHREELGDLLFQVVFQAALRERQGEFTVEDVCVELVEKMVRRHPHIFANVQVADANEVLRNWGQIKDQEKANAGKKRGTLDGIPVSAPALERAQKLGEKAAKVGFDWPDLAGVQDKLTEELHELQEAQDSHNVAAMKHELGDVLFTLTRVASKLGFSAEDALRDANRRFVKRFTTMEATAQQAGSRLADLTLDQMNEHWNAAKRS